MILVKTPIQDALYVVLEPHKDERGVFAEGFVRSRLAKEGLDFAVEQVNLSKSDRAGTVRGMHWQADPFSQGKVVYAVCGRVWDAIVDVRKDSPSFGKSFGVELWSQANALFVPKGVAHGYQALTDGSIVMYLVDSAYSPGHEKGLRYDDPTAAISWPYPPINVAPKDLKWPFLTEIGERHG
jgi:dTDP-4-dehydrorhamnose 3,5-epimerase